MKKWKVMIAVKGQLRETVVYATDQNAALAIARAQFVGADLRYAVEAKSNERIMLRLNERVIPCADCEHQDSSRRSRPP